MKKNDKIPRTLGGDWDWRVIDALLPKGWITIRHNPPGDHIWTFFDDGSMISRQGDRLRYVVSYRYNPDKRWLILEGWQLNNRGERETLVLEAYRVEFPDPDTMYLYDLEDVAPGEQESLRLVLRRV